MDGQQTPSSPARAARISCSATKVMTVGSRETAHHHLDEMIAQVWSLIVQEMGTKQQRTPAGHTRRAEWNSVVNKVTTVAPEK